MVKKKFSYAEAGVDIAKHREAHAVIGRLIESTFQLRKDKTGRVLTPFGHYAALIELDEKRALALHSDGVGSKVLVAQAAEKYDTVGIDCVAMCVNDLICVGAEPISLVDYLAVQEPNQSLIEEVMKGLVKGAEIADVAIVGGETAILPEVISGAVQGRGFDLSATVVGIVDKDKAVTGKDLKPGDAILGLESSGIHSNGLTLARKIFFEKAKLGVHDEAPGLKRAVGEELLEPTKIYVKEIMDIIKSHQVHALAHITGGTFSKLKRFRDYSKTGFLIDDMPEPQPIFRVIQRLGGVSDEEMYRTFNMGVGFCVVCPDREADSILKALRVKFRARVRQIGVTTKETAIRLRIPSKEELVLG